MVIRYELRHRFGREAILYSCQLIYYWMVIMQSLMNHQVMACDWIMTLDTWPLPASAWVLEWECQSIMILCTQYNKIKLVWCTEKEEFCLKIKVNQIAENKKFHQCWQMPLRSKLNQVKFPTNHHLKCFIALHRSFYKVHN